MAYQDRRRPLATFLMLLTCRYRLVSEEFGFDLTVPTSNYIYKC